ncbi:MAG: hypothetical protein WD185_09295 [Sneathiella sp.]
MTNEKTILNRCLLTLGKLRHMRVWRNNTGQAWAGKAIPLQAGQSFRAQEGDVLVKAGYPVRFGLPGSGDIIGLERIRITPEMVGQDIARFCSFEVKGAKGREGEQQSKFRKMVRVMGGRAELVRDPDDINRMLGGADNDN